MNLITLLFTDEFVEFLQTADSDDIAFVEDCLKHHFAGDKNGYTALQGWRDFLNDPNAIVNWESAYKEIAESLEKADNTLTEAARQINILEARVSTLEDLLRFAEQNLRYEIPYPDPESEYDQCCVCGEPDWNHADDCTAVAWKALVKEVLAKPVQSQPMKKSKRKAKVNQ